MRKLHFSEFIAALNGASMIFEQFLSCADVSQRIATGSSWHVVVFTAINHGQKLYGLSVIDTTGRTPVLIEAVVM